MIKVVRFEDNPILSPDPESDFEKEAVFNGCPVEKDRIFYFVYRAVSSIRNISGLDLELSTIGCSRSNDRINFQDRRQLIFPEYDWEKYGCEDPRVTGIGENYYIFYTALSKYPFAPEGIKVAVAKTHDFEKIDEKHLVTHFNSKAMALFPEKINGKITAILTANTDIPPSTIGIAFFDYESQIWSRKYWQQWYRSMQKNSLTLLRSNNDHVELGAPPVKTEKGWLIIFSYITNYLSHARIFGIEAVLLDINNPLKVISVTRKPLFIPERDYELFGKVPNVIFPSGALLSGGDLGIYYGAADTSCCLATCKLEDLLCELSES